MIDITLFFGKLVLLALVYLFLLAAMRAGLRALEPRTNKRERGAQLGLAVVEGPSEIQGVKLPLDSPVLIGRSPKSDLVIGDSFVSSQHARVGFDKRGVFVEDLGSTNGTIVRGRRISSPTRLKPGDDVVIGDVILRLEKL